MEASEVHRLNINVGCLGHVDSGKTSLVAALSTRLSTAALDKHPQSKARGITLDLGFSSFSAPLDDGEVQFTLVDCPGHASLVKTVVGGSHIIDMMILVVDITKGIQPQTAECIVIGEITTDFMIVVLNKIDLIPLEKRDKYAKRASKMIHKTFAGTRFKDVPIVAVSTKERVDGTRVSDMEDRSIVTGGEHHEPFLGLEELVNTMVRLVPEMNVQRKEDGDFMMYIDHCFSIKGQGTIVTGTLSEGCVSVGESIQFPLLGLVRKVKSIQAFKKPVHRAVAGDRVGMCVSNLPSGQIERGLACKPGSMVAYRQAIVRVDKVRFFPNRIYSRKKLHILIGHSSMMATLEFFGMPRFSTREWIQASDGDFAWENDYIYQEELYGAEGRPIGNEDWYKNSDWRLKDKQQVCKGPQWALIRFEEPVLARPGALFVGAKLDTDLDACTCRIALSGKIVSSMKETSKLRVFRIKIREGTLVEFNKMTAICTGMFASNNAVLAFLGMYVRGPHGVVGVIDSPYGTKGDCRIKFHQPVHMIENEPPTVVLKFKQFIHASDQSSKKREIEQ